VFDKSQFSLLTHARVVGCHCAIMCISLTEFGMLAIAVPSIKRRMDDRCVRLGDLVSGHWQPQLQRSEQVTPWDSPL